MQRSYHPMHEGVFHVVYDMKDPFVFDSSTRAADRDYGSSITFQ
jgi:hypothetical protein